MSSVKNRKWVLRSKPVGYPKRSDVEIVTEELPPLAEGGMPVNNYFEANNFFFFFSLLAELLMEAVWLSVDPYMRLA